MWNVDIFVINTVLVQVVLTVRSRKSKQKKKNMLQYYPHEVNLSGNRVAEVFLKGGEALLSTMGRGEDD